MFIEVCADGDMQWSTRAFPYWFMWTKIDSDFSNEHRLSLRMHWEKENESICIANWCTKFCIIVSGSLYVLATGYATFPATDTNTTRLQAIDLWEHVTFFVQSPTSSYSWRILLIFMLEQTEKWSKRKGKKKMEKLGDNRLWTAILWKIKKWRENGFACAEHTRFHRIWKRFVQMTQYIQRTYAKLISNVHITHGICIAMRGPQIGIAIYFHSNCRLKVIIFVWFGFVYIYIVLLYLLEKNEYFLLL